MQTALVHLCLTFLILWCSLAKGASRFDFGAFRQIHNFVYYAADREHISDSEFLNAVNLEGAQLLYTWKQLEPTEDVYDFSAIDSDLRFLSYYGKKLFIQVMDTTFDPESFAVPEYLRVDPRFHGGVVPQYDENKPAGWVMMRWDPRVRSRFHKLLRKLGKAFDGKIEGITLQETAIDVVLEGQPLPKGFGYDIYRDAIKSNMLVAKQSFAHSTVIQYANFMPGEWLPDDDHFYLRSIYEYAEKLNVGVGSPDLMPNKKSYQDHAYKLMHERAPNVPVGIAVQDGNYIGATNDTSVPDDAWPNLVPKLWKFGVEYLRANYFFWGAQQPYFSHDVIPFFSSHCGTTWSKKVGPSKFGQQE